MAWTAPRTYTAGEVVTAAILNTHVRDNLRFLRGLDGVITVDSGLIIDNTDGDEYFKLPNHTTSECSSVLTVEARVAYDETLHKVKYYSSGSVEIVLARDDVDDVPVDSASTVPISSNWAYDFINTLSASGDIPYANGAGSWTRLGKGTAGQYFVMNNSATAPTWISAVPPTKVVKTANETVSNNTTLQNDDELKIGLGASTAWEFSCFVISNSNTSADIKAGFTAPAGASLYGYTWYVNPADGSPTWAAGVTNIQSQGTGNNLLSHIFKGVVTTSASGDLQLQWTQAASDATQTTVLQNSCIIAHQLL